MHPQIIQRIGRDTGISQARIEATLLLLEDGFALPYVARYRKEVTGDLDERQIADIANRYSSYRQLEKRKAEILAAIDKAGSGSDPVRTSILDCDDALQLEDLYLPYRSRSATRGAAARKRGLKALADYIRQGHSTDAVRNRAQAFTDLKNAVFTIPGAIQGAMDILVEELAQDAGSRTWLRDKMLSEGTIHATLNKAKASNKTKYSMYHDFSEPVLRISSHRLLEVRRAAREKILTFSVRIDHEKALGEFKSRLSIEEGSGLPLESAADEAYRRLLEPAIQKQVRSLLRSRAEDEAIEVFKENVRALLMAAPAGQIPLIGIDPGLEKGAHIAAVKANGSLLEHETIRLLGPKADLEAAEKVMIGLINAHAIRGVVVGSGRGAKETHRFVRSFLSKSGLRVFAIAAPDSTTSPMLAKQTRREFRNLDFGFCRAISSARRLQDPLSELIKVDPRSIGIGQYQHDVDQRKLRECLANTVESAVGRVGADVNMASARMLGHIAGISDKLARSLVSYRKNHGPFSDRTQFRQVDGFDDKVFQQSAGFLRITDGVNPLDRTSIHPESYQIVEDMARSLNLTVKDLFDNPAHIKAVDLERLGKEHGVSRLGAVRGELLAAGWDPRRAFVPPRMREDVTEVTDLKEGMELEGVVTNVASFGAFVDLGIQQDGLVHISELAHRYVSDARRAVQVGSLIKVKVIGVDKDGKRISLSRKALLPKPPVRPKTRPNAKAKNVSGEARKNARLRLPKTKERAVPLKDVSPKKHQSMEDKIRQLQEKFKAPDR